MIIDMTGNVSLSSLEGKDLDSDDSVFDWEAYGEWREYRDEKMKMFQSSNPPIIPGAFASISPIVSGRRTAVRKQAIEIVKNALHDDRMRNILKRACRSEIRSEVAKIISSLTLSISLSKDEQVISVATRIVELDQESRQGARNDRT